MNVTTRWVLIFALVVFATCVPGGVLQGLTLPPQDQEDEGDDELVDEFLRFYNPKRSTRERIEAIYVLKGSSTIAATKALTKAFDDKEIQVVQAAVETVGTFKDPDSVQFLIDQYITNKKEKKESRITAAVECLGLMGDDRAADALLDLFKRVKSWELKQAMGTALGRLKTERCLPSLELLIQDKDPTLRIVAVDAMALINMPYAPVNELKDKKGEIIEGVEPIPCYESLVRVLNEESDWQVRAAAIQAVRSMRFREGVQPLIDRLRVEEGRLRGDAYDALKELTFSQYDDDPDQWQRFWDRNKDTFVIPDLSAVLEARAKRAEEGTRYSNPTASFAGIPTKSRRIMFIIDISGSMETQVTEIERFREGGRDYASFQRLEIVKKELSETIGSFDDSVHFNILAFATKLKWWKKNLVRSNILNKSSAKDFVSKLKPIGGASAGFKARAGLKPTALGEGKTNTYGALMAGLGIEEEDDLDNQIGRKTFRNKVDTIYFLSDGQPTVGKIVDQTEIRGLVRKVNSVRKVILHCIAIGDFQKNFMKSLAQENGGVYVDLGK